MLKDFKNLLILLSSVALVGCSKEVLQEGAIIRKDYTVTCREGGTRAAFLPGNVIGWESGDKISYYVCKSVDNTRVGNITSDVPVNRISTELAKVTTEFTLGPDRIVMVYKGSSLANEIANADLTKFELKGAIPATVDGSLGEDKMVPSYQVSRAIGDVGVENLQFTHLQSFISFTLLNGTYRENALAYGNKTVSYVKITGNNGENIAGDVRYDLTTDEMSTPHAILTGSGYTPSTEIKISNFEVGKKYYVAVMSGTYTKGLRLTFYSADNTRLCYSDVKGNDGKFVLAKNKITDLGELDFHQVVPGTYANLHPTTAAIVNSHGIAMTKKLWLEYRPKDVSKISWTLKSGTGLSTDGTITQGPVEYVTLDDGITQDSVLTAIFKPGASVTSGKFVVVVTLDGDNTLSTIQKECTIEVGEVVDLGLPSVCWCVSNMKGAKGGSGTSALGMVDYGDKGDWYAWGMTAPLDLTIKDKTLADRYSLRPGGTWTSGSGKNDWGGYYNGYTGQMPADLKLLADDDVVSCYNSNFSMATLADYTELFKETNTTKSRTIGATGVANALYTSLIKWYTDMYVALPNGGCVVDITDGVTGYKHIYCYHQVSQSSYWTKECVGTGTWTDPKGTSRTGYGFAKYVVTQGAVGTYNYNRTFGFLVRGVRRK